MSETTVRAMTRSVSTFLINRSIIVDVPREIRVVLVVVLEKSLDSSNDEKAYKITRSTRHFSVQITSHEQFIPIHINRIQQFVKETQERSNISMRRVIHNTKYVTIVLYSNNLTVYCS